MGAMAPGAHSLVRMALLLLPALMLCEALPASWLPGIYANNISDALRFLSDYNSTAEEVFFNSVSASWNYNTNLTEHNSKLQVAASLEEQAFIDAWGGVAKQVFSNDVLDSLPAKDKKLVKKIMLLGAANLPQAEREE
ncbi:hypothetical protein GOODEAATRI_026713, partial [Goodea atripinnis]